ncbi:MAG: TolC family protein, partial [Planctomycetes bacterium]|nr:TolC family protein [Planctomycetota bacterium]
MRFCGRLVILSAVPFCCLAGCRPAYYRVEADKVAYGIIDRAQKQALGRAEPFTIERPADSLRRKLLLEEGLPHAGAASLGAEYLKPIAHWPEKDYPARPEGPLPETHLGKGGSLTLSLVDALRVAARNNREYQTRKEDVFRAALALDLQANQFRNLLFGDAETEYSANYSGADAVRGLANTGTASWQRRLKNGTLLTAEFAVDLVKLLTLDRSSSLGLFADATITMPLLSGAGRHIATEDLIQAEREVVYSLYSFGRVKRTLAVRVAS